MTTLGTIISNFFCDHLGNEKGVAASTISSYSDAIKLLLEYACETLHITIDKLAPDTISDTMILDFLDHLETQRNNTVSTRNQRLAVIKSFYRFLARQEPSLLAVCERVCAIRSKKTEEKPVQTLETDEVQAILDTPDIDTLSGARDAVVLGLFANTGARVQELVDLDLTDIRLDGLRQATLTGKGSKQRVVPIWKETACAISHYLQLRQEAGIESDALFLNARGQRITRFGLSYLVDKNVSQAANRCPSLKDKHVTPHTFRHTVALHLIQEHENIATVKELLGHASIKTTHKYVEIDMNMKRKAIEGCAVRTQQHGQSPQQTIPKWRTPKILAFLKEISRGTALC